MIYLAYVIIVLSSLAAGVYLAITDHPWFALLAFIIAGSARVKTKSCDCKKKALKDNPLEPLPDISPLVKVKTK
jgi:hypothetical protein